MIDAECLSKEAEFLEASWLKYLKPLENNLISTSYKEKSHILHHGNKPWSTLDYNGGGSFTYGKDYFFLKGELTNNAGVAYKTKGQFSPTGANLLGYGDSSITRLPQQAALNYKLSMAKYSLILLLNYFYEIRRFLKITDDKKYSHYTADLGESRVTISINKNNLALGSAEIILSDDLYGDSSTKYYYNDYIPIKNSSIKVPRVIIASKHNGKIKDAIKLTYATITVDPPLIFTAQQLNTASDNLRPKNNNLTKIPTVNTERFIDNIYTIKLSHTASISLAVEFDDFFMIIEALLNSNNGDLIINAAKEINNEKPIKYFAFSHHPHYLGGLRSFVAAGSTVITSKWNDAYIKSLIKAKHTLNPDSLEQKRKEPIIKMLHNDKLIISDGKYDVEAHHIGDNSSHSRGYLIFYFPKEKILFEGDLIWIDKEKTNPINQKTKNRLKKLIQAVDRLDLNVETILQS